MGETRLTIKYVVASIGQRLVNLGREEGQVSLAVLVSFGPERLVYRLIVLDCRDRFVRKGGMLVALWTAETGRFTRGIVFLAFGSAEEAQMKQSCAAILAVDGHDGLIYNTAGPTAAHSCDDQVYGGMPLRTNAFLGTTQIPITE